MHVKTIINHRISEWSILPIYGEFGNGLLLLQPHYIFCKYLMQLYMYDIYIYI